MRNSLLVLGFACLGASEPALAERIAVTPSGQAEGVFTGSSLSDAGGRLVNTCMDAGFQVMNQTPNQITCELPMGMWRSALTQMLIGNSYSTTPRSYLAISLAQTGPNVRAQARAWVETQMAFGQVRQHQYTDDGSYNNLIGFLGRAGAELPRGTYFVGAYAGFDYTPQSATTSALDVTKVLSLGPAAKAGLRIGDRIVSVNGKKFKNAEDFGKKMRALKPGNFYSFGIQRDGQPVELTLNYMVRPTVGTPEYDALMAEWRGATASVARPNPDPTAAVAPMPIEPSETRTPTPPSNKVISSSPTAVSAPRKSQATAVAKPGITCVTCQ